MADWRLVFYRTREGRCPVEDYLRDAGGTEAAKIAHDLALLRTRGLTLGFPQVSHIEGKIFELRIRGRQAHRVLYFAGSGQEFVLLGAFTKRTPKTPRAEIEAAKARMQDYERRQREG